MPFHDLVLLYLVFIMSSSGDFYHLKHFLVNPSAARTLPGHLIIFLISCAFLWLFMNLTFPYFWFYQMLLKLYINHAFCVFSSVQSLSHVRLFATPWIAACWASLPITNSQSLLKLMSIESVMPSSHLILCRSLLLLPPIPPSIRVFSNESTLCMKCLPHYIILNT